jgi:hypothetical protein
MQPSKCAEGYICLANFLLYFGVQKANTQTLRIISAVVETFNFNESHPFHYNMPLRGL